MSGHDISDNSRNSVGVFSICLLLLSVILTQKLCYCYEDNEVKLPIKFCFIEGYKDIYWNSKAQCERLKQLTPLFECVITVDRLDCLKKIWLNDADIAVFEPEELLFAHLHPLVDSVKVIAEYQHYYNKNIEFQYSMAVVVKNDLSVRSIEDLRGKHLCHPGFDLEQFDQLESFTQFFESTIFPHHCYANLTITENKIRALADNLHSSCMPGPWSSDPDYDTILKDKYGKLCSNCGEPETCSIEDKYWGRNSLLCVADCYGDYTWGTVSTIKRYFAAKSHKTQYTECNAVSYLCMDGSKQNILTENPCVWIQRPNKVLVARTNREKVVQEMIDKVFIKQTEGKDYRNILSTLIGAPPRFYLVNTSNPSDYLKKAKNFLNAKFSLCASDRAVKICTFTSYQLSRCMWLSAAAQTYDLEIPIECFSKPNITLCFQLVDNQELDLTIIYNDDYMTAVRDYGLAPLIMDAASSKYKKYHSLLVDTEANITTLDDLRGKNICLDSIDGVGWNTILIALKRHSLLPKECPYVAAMSKFFGEICISKSFDKNISTKYSNIKLCQEHSMHELDPSKIEDNTVKCLLEGGGHATIIAVDAIDDYLHTIGENNREATKAKIGKRYKWLCENGLTESKDCLLSEATQAQVMVDKDLSYVRREDISSLFLSLDILLGSGRRQGRRAFNFDLVYEAESHELDDDSGGRLELADYYIRRHKWQNTTYETAIYEIMLCDLKTELNDSTNKLKIKTPIKKANLIKETVTTTHSFFIYLTIVVLVISIGILAYRYSNRLENLVV